MKPIKKIRDAEAEIKKRAEEQTRRKKKTQQEDKERQAKEAEERRAEKRREKLAKPPVRESPRDYEPPNKPYSKLNARCAILQKMIEIEGARSHVQKLFDLCYGTYLNWQLRGQKTADWHDLEQRLKQWARDCHIEDEWFVSFALQALSRYWVVVNERRRKNLYYRALTGKEIETKSAFEYQLQAWRQAVARFSVEEPTDWDLSPPSPPEGLPMINTNGRPTVATRKDYRRLVSLDLFNQLKNGSTMLLSNATRRRWVKEAMDELRPLIDSFWFEYSNYLYLQGWVPIKSKKFLNLHSGWLVHSVVLGIPHVRIADTVDRQGGISESAISDAIRDLASRAGMRWGERRGRKTS